MLLTLPDTPLHTALKSHLTQRLIEYLQRGRYLPLLNQVDSNGLTALQLAASLGMIDAMLWLIYAGANIDAYQASTEFDDQLAQAQKPSLYLATEAQHILLSEIFLCLGADKQHSLAVADAWHEDATYSTLKHLNLNTRAFQSILFWTVEHYHETYQNHLLCLLQRQILSTADHQESAEEKHPGLTRPLLAPTPAVHNDEKIPLTHLRSCLFGLSEYAMYTQRPTLALALIQLNQGLIRMNFDNPTVVYWAVKQHNETLYTPWIQNNPELINVTLQQLEATGALEDYDYFFSKLNNSQQESCLQTKPLNTTNITLTPLQQKLYHRAKFHLSGLFASASVDTADDCLVVLNYAWQQHDYVALKLLIPYFNQSTLLTHVIQKNHSDLLIHLMFRTNLYPFEIIQKIPSSIKIPFTSFLRLLAPEETSGIVQQWISHGLKNSLTDDRQPHEIKQQKAYFKALKITPECFLKHYAKYFNLPLVANNRISLPVNANNIILKNIMRFGMQLSEQSYDGPSNNQSNNQNSLLCQITDTIIPGPGQLILDHLNNSDKIHFYMTSKKSHHYLRYSLKHKINQFLQVLTQELHAQTYWQHRAPAPYTDCRSGFSGLISAAFLIAIVSICAVELQNNIQQLHALQITLTNTPNSLDRNHYCDSYDCLWDNTAPNNSSCEPLCEESALIYRIIIVLSLCGIAFPGAILLAMLVALVPTIYILSLGNSRFDHLPLTTFSIDLNSQAERLFAELNKHSPLDDTFLSNDSSIARIRTTLKKLTHQLQLPTNSVRFFKAAAEPSTIEEINDEQAPTPNKAVGASPCGSPVRVKH